MKSAMGEGNWTDKQCLLQSQPVSLFPSHEPCSSPSAPVRTSRANKQTNKQNQGIYTHVTVVQIKRK